MDYFFKCTVKSITYTQDGSYELGVIPVAEFSVKNGDNTFVAFLPNGEALAGELLKYEGCIELNVKNVKATLLHMLKLASSCVVYFSKERNLPKTGAYIKMGNSYYKLIKVKAEA